MKFKKPHLLIAVDAFGDIQMEAFAQAVEGWATWERMPETASPDEYMAKLASAEIMIGWPEPAWLLPNPVRLLLCPSVGYDDYLGQGLETKRDFTFCNSSGAYDTVVTEHCLALMMALARRLPQYVRAMQTSTWHQLPGHNRLSGATACIVGLGRIGKMIARRCDALGMTVTGVDLITDQSLDTVDQIFSPEHLQEAVAAADHVIASVPGGPATEKLIDGAVFESMKRGSYFYNISRGSVVDENSLVTGLQSGHLAGAGLDVFADEPLPGSSPLSSMDNVILTPHIAGHTPDIADELCALMTTNLRRYHEGKPLLNVIDLGRIDS